MEKDFNLYQHIIKMVEMQIESGSPPATRETFQRLVKNGDDEETAKEKIAVVIAEELYVMMSSEDKKMDPEKFSRKLSLLE